MVEESKKIDTLSNLLTRSRLSFRKLATDVPIEDNNEPIITIEQTDKIILKPFWETPGDLEGETYRQYLINNPDFKLRARLTVCEKLETAARTLPDDWQLIVKAGLRPLSVQLDLLDAVKRDVQSANPLLSEKEALQHARTFVTDPAILCPPHCSGAAVDVDAINASNGDPIDFGCPPNTDNELAFTHNPGITKEQTTNRMILLNAMLSAGFSNLAYEWWHYSYGDQYWAAFYGEPVALYDVVNC